MSWIERVLPHKSVVSEDLESRGVNAEAWWRIAESTDLLQRCAQCYSSAFGKGRFDKALHETGVRLRLDSYCRKILEEYPELHK